MFNFFNRRKSQQRIAPLPVQAVAKPREEDTVMFQVVSAIVAKHMAAHSDLVSGLEATVSALALRLSDAETEVKRVHADLLKERSRRSYLLRRLREGGLSCELSEAEESTDHPQSVSNDFAGPPKFVGSGLNETITGIVARCQYGPGHEPVLLLQDGDKLLPIRGHNLRAELEQARVVPNDMVRAKLGADGTVSLKVTVLSRDHNRALS